MRFSEFFDSKNTELESVIVNTLQNLRGDADEQGQTAEVSFTALEQIIKNTGYPTFNYNLFKQMYDQGTTLKNVVDDFDQEKIVLKTEKQAEKEPTMNKDRIGSTDTVKKMAQSAMKRRS
jgi:hypothetical protein